MGQEIHQLRRNLLPIVKLELIVVDWEFCTETEFIKSEVIVLECFEGVGVEDTLGGMDEIPKWDSISWK